MHVNALVGRQPEGLVGRAFEAERLGPAIGRRLAHRHVVGAELGRREDRAHSIAEMGALPPLAAAEGQRHAGPSPMFACPIHGTMIRQYPSTESPAVSL